MNILQIDSDGTYISQDKSRYKLLIISNDTNIHIDQIFRLSEQIVMNPVKLVAAWGVKCYDWDDSIDSASTSGFTKELPDEDRILTSWHENETISDVLNYLKHCDGFNNCDDGPIHVLIVGDSLCRLSEIESQICIFNDGA